jgi:hypothetical protein
MIHRKEMQSTVQRIGEIMLATFDGPGTMVRGEEGSRMLQQALS